MDIELWFVVVGVVAFFAWVLGRWTGATGAAKRQHRALVQLEQRLRMGEPIEVSDFPDISKELARLVEVLGTRSGPGENESLRIALQRISGFLKEGVERPLSSALRGRGGLAKAARTAVASVEDLAFFLTEPSPPNRTQDLRSVVRAVSREYASECGIAVKVKAAKGGVNARIDEDSFKDALYLLLHNAGRFGTGESIEMSVKREGDKALICIRDQGPGFTSGALRQGFEPFFTTRRGSLGLGLTYAHRAIKSCGGDIVLGSWDRGAQVSVTLPTV